MPGKEPPYQIGEVAEAVGLSLRTIRYYEEVGLLPAPTRSAGGFRLYGDDDIARLSIIKQMKPLDFTLEEMADVLALREQLSTARASGRGTDELLGRLAIYASLGEQRCDALRDQLAAAEGLVASIAALVRGPATTDKSG